MKQELLIDAMYINDGGGKILLDYLIKKLEKTDRKVFYLLDQRVKNKIPPILNSKNEIIYLEASLLKRYLFYKKYNSRFSSVLCFGNLPPNIKLSAEVYTYFHQPLFLEIPQKMSFVQKLLYKIKTVVLKKLIKNTTFFIVQSNFIKNRLAEKYSINQSSIKVIPFYPELKYVDCLKIKNTFAYISNATPHKNHVRLINAFCQFYDKYKVGILTLTVGESFEELIGIIDTKLKNGYPINNIGFVDRTELAEVYSTQEYHIYPSLAESFGLGLIESIEAGCKVIGADLPYTYEVCDPSIVFNPLSEQSIFEAFEYAVSNDIKKSIPVISDQIDNLLKLI